MNARFIPIVAAIALALAAHGNALAEGAQSSPSAAPAKAQPAKVNSGFLSNASYAKLKPVEGVDGAMRYVDKSIDIRPYTKILLDPVQVYLAPNPEYKGLQPDALKRMTDAFQAAFVDAVSSGYQVVTAPGPDVLRVRLAITGVQPVSPGLTPIDFLPIKALFNAGRAAAGAEPRVAEISAEIEVLDPNNRQVAAAVATRKSDKTLEQGSNIRWSDLQPIVVSWAKTFRQGLDTARGVAAPK
jgi:hypothetical protein